MHEKNGELKLAAVLDARRLKTLQASPNVTTRCAKQRARTSGCGTTTDTTQGLSIQMRGARILRDRNQA